MQSALPARAVIGPLDSGHDLQGDADGDQRGAQGSATDPDGRADELDDHPGNIGLRRKRLVERPHQLRGHHAEQDPGQTGDDSVADEPVDDGCHRVGSIRS